MLKNWQMDNVRRYTFIDLVKRVGLYYHLYYTHEGKELFKKVHMRSNIAKVQKAVNEIKKEIGVGLYGQARDKIYVVGN